MKEKRQGGNEVRAVFASRFAAIATTVGSAVGLGNIWRFPYEAGVHGGGAFLICYIAFVLLIGVPVLCAEFCVGRASRSNVFGAYRKLAPGSRWHYAGYIGILASVLILSFYSVVAGWTMEYTFSSLTGSLDFSDRIVGHEKFLLLTTGWRPLLWTIIFLIINSVVMLGGVSKGIEKLSNVLMPLLFVILLAFCINSFFMPGFGEGISFLFNPDFSQITPRVVLGALGQAFFSLSLGLGGMMTYASYFSKNTNLGRSAVTTAFLDTLVAILAGIMIFPAVFSFGLSPEQGPTLVFEVLPFIFSQLPGGIIWSTLFFFLLVIASITSSVSMSEISIAFFHEERKISRKKATIISFLITLIGGILCALSFGVLGNLKIAGLNLFNLFDYVSSNICLPVGAMICSVFTGWIVDKHTINREFSGRSNKRARWVSVLIFMLKWICPSAIMLIFLNSIGIV